MQLRRFQSKETTHKKIAKGWQKTKQSKKIQTFQKISPLKFRCERIVFRKCHKDKVFLLCVFSYVFLEFRKLRIVFHKHHSCKGVLQCVISYENLDFLCVEIVCNIRYTGNVFLKKVFIKIKSKISSHEIMHRIKFILGSNLRFF